MEIFKSIIAAIASFFALLSGRQQAANTASAEQAGADAVAASDNKTAAKVAGAEAQAINDVPADNEGLAKIADKGKW